MSRRESGSTWRFEIAGDVLTAANKVMIYTIKIGVPYHPTEHARLSNKGPIGPRSVTQFLDGGARLYTIGSERGASGRASARTVANVSSFVGTYLVPRVPVSPSVEPESATPSNEERLVRIEASLVEAFALLRSIADGLGVK